MKFIYGIINDGELGVLEFLYFFLFMFGLEKFVRDEVDLKDLCLFLVMLIIGGGFEKYVLYWGW